MNSLKYIFLVAKIQLLSSMLLNAITSVKDSFADGKDDYVLRVYDILIALGEKAKKAKENWNY